MAERSAVDSLLSELKNLDRLDAAGKQAVLLKLGLGIALDPPRAQSRHESATARPGQPRARLFRHPQS